MSRLVADASVLVGLEIGADDDPDPLSLCLAQYEVVVSKTVIEELQKVASYDNAHGRAATAVLEKRSVDIGAEFPLDDGESGAVTLSNEVDAALFLYDECNQRGLIHASLAGTRLVTTPTMLSVLVRTEQLSGVEARMLLEKISDARSGDANSYVQQTRSVLSISDNTALKSVGR